MAVLMLSVAGGLVLLTGVAVYSALVLARKTDEILARMDTDDSVTAPMVVRFPDSVFQQKHVAHVQK